MKRNRPQPRSLSGKFSRYAQYEEQDIINQSVAWGHSCLAVSPDTAFGVMRGNVWWLKTALLTQDKTGTKRPVYKRAAQLLIEHRRGAPLLANESLYRTCRTVGCLNHEHYIVEVKEMFTRQQVRIIYEAAREQGQVLLPYGDRKTAERKRLQVYNHKTYFKKNEPGFFATIEEFKWFVVGGDLLCAREQEDEEDSMVWQAAGLPQQSEVDESIALLEKIKTDRPAGTGESVVNTGDKILSDLGYTPNKPPEGGVADDCPYDLDNPPEPQDVDYDVFIGWSISPAGKTAFKKWKEKTDELSN